MAGVDGLKDGDDIRDSDHVVRYCKPRHILQDGRISEPAFALRESEEYLSVNWLEYFSVNMRTPEQVLQKIRDTIGLELSRKARFAKICVGEAKRRIEGAQVKYRPIRTNISHAGLYTSEQNRDRTLELANLVIEIFPGMVD